MLLGEIHYKVGQKHRLALPRKFRDQLGSQLVVTRGYEGCLVVVNQSEWQSVVRDVVDGSFLDMDARESARFLLGGASQIDLDSQGRFIVPSSLFEYADLHDEVVFVGLDSWLEIWSLERWQQQVEVLSSQGSAVAQRLSDKQRHSL